MTESKKRGEGMSWIRSLIIAFILALIIRQFVLTPVLVSGPSMEPTYHDEDRVMVMKLYTLNHFDRIVFEAPNTDSLYIKRVIGLSGDQVKMVDDQLYINDELYEEPYVQENKEKVFPGQKLTEDFEVVVPEGRVFVLGDNRRRSIDSRTEEVGMIEERAVVGKVLFRFYPIKKSS